MSAYVSFLTAFHTLISLIALPFGVAAVRGLFGNEAAGRWTGWFLVLAVATSVTGFFFPFAGVTPAFLVGIVALIVLAGVLYARYSTDMTGIWKMVYSGGMIISLYLLVFVTIAQAFDKIPVLNAIAPTPQAPAFAVVQLIALAVFAFLGWKAIRQGP